MFVWGIDPGLSRCGYAVLDTGRAVAPGRRGAFTGARLAALGVLTTSPQLSLPARLHALQHDVRELVAEHPPGAVAIERILFSVNVRTAIGVAQAAAIVMVEAIEAGAERSGEHTSELQSLMRISYAVFCLKKKKI